MLGPAAIYIAVQRPVPPDRDPDNDLTLLLSAHTVIAVHLHTLTVLYAMRTTNTLREIQSIISYDFIISYHRATWCTMV